MTELKVDNNVLTQEELDTAIELALKKKEVIAMKMNSTKGIPTWKPHSDSIKDMLSLIVRDLESQSAFDHVRKMNVSSKNDFLCEHMNKYLLFIADKIRPYVWNGSIYEPLNQSLFFQYAKPLYKAIWCNWTVNRSEQLYKMMRMDSWIPDFNIDKRFVPFRNGLFNLETKELESFDETLHFTKLYPAEYTTQEPVMFLKALRQILPDDDSRMRVLKFFRYSFEDNVDEQYAQIWLGKGANGKSKLSELWSDIQGEYCTEFDMHQADNEYMRARLCGKRLAICNEQGGYLPQRIMDRIKSVITDKNFTAAKKFQPDVTWCNETKFIVLANLLPRLQNSKDEAFFRRWEIIHFTEQFTGDNADPTLFSRIFREEGAAILSYVLREIDIDDIGKKIDYKKVAREWLDLANVVNRFLKEGWFTGEVTDYMLEPTTKLLYQEFIKWANNQGDVQIVSRKAFGIQMTDLGFAYYQKADGQNYYKLKIE